MEIKISKLVLSKNGSHEIYIKEVISSKTTSCNKDKILVVVHGGPGHCNHAELLPGFFPKDAKEKTIFNHIDRLSKIVFYDQLGTGLSDKPNNPDCYSLELYVSELAEVLKSQQKSPEDQLFLLGHSFGGQIVTEFLLEVEKVKDHESTLKRKRSILRHEIGDILIDGVLICNSPLNEETYLVKQIELRENLDEDIRNFYNMDEDELASNGSIESLVYGKLIGNGESRITGEMKSWSALNRLEKFENIRVLFITGDEDNIPFEEYEWIRSSMLKFNTEVEVLIIPGGGHAPFFEKRSSELFWKCCSDFVNN